MLRHCLAHPVTELFGMDHSEETELYHHVKVCLYLKLIYGEKYRKFSAEQKPEV